MKITEIPDIPVSNHPDILVFKQRVLRPKLEFIRYQNVSKVSLVSLLFLAS